MVDRDELIISSTNSPKEVLIQLVHDFRAPIAALYGYATIIQRNSCNADIVKYASEMQKISQNLQSELKLVDNYLRAIKSEIGPDDDEKYHA